MREISAAILWIGAATLLWSVWKGGRMRTSVLRIDTLTSPPVTIPDARLYLRSQAVQLRFPSFHGGLIWNRPVAAVVRTTAGREEIIPILDITWIILFTLAGFCFASTVVLLFLRRRKFRS